MNKGIKPHIIVLILSYNGKHLLDDSMSSYLANDYPNFEVTVVDNGSTDGTEEWVKVHYPSVSVLRTEKNLKYSRRTKLRYEIRIRREKCRFCSDNQ